MSTFPQHLGWDHRPSICNNGNGTTEHSGGPMACAVLLKHATTTHNWSENCIQSLKVCVNTPAPFPRKDPCFFRQDWCQKENYTPLTDERWRKPLYHALLLLLVFRVPIQGHTQMPRSMSCSDTAPTGHLHHFGGRPFHRSQVLFVFMVLSQQVSLGVPLAVTRLLFLFLNWLMGSRETFEETFHNKLLKVVITFAP